MERVDEQDRVLGVVDRGDAVRNRWLHRIATTVCRDPEGRFLVHRRSDGVSRFPGQYNWLIGGAVDVGESYASAAPGNSPRNSGSGPMPASSSGSCVEERSAPTGSASTKPRSTGPSRRTPRRSPGTRGSPRTNCGPPSAAAPSCPTDGTPSPVTRPSPGPPAPRGEGRRCRTAPLGGPDRAPSSAPPLAAEAPDRPRDRPTCDPVSKTLQSQPDRAPSYPPPLPANAPTGLPTGPPATRRDFAKSAGNGFAHGRVSRRSPGPPGRTRRRSPPRGSGSARRAWSTRSRRGSWPSPGSP